MPCIKAEIKCPCCNNEIFIDTKLLIEGNSFKCSNLKCNASVSMSASSSHVAQEAYEEFKSISISMEAN